MDRSRIFPLLLIAGIPLLRPASAVELERISRTSYELGETQPGEFQVEENAFSIDGRFLVFATKATAVAPGVVDLNGDLDIFVRDLQTGTVTLVSHAHDQPMRTASRGSEAPKISADGRFVVFRSLASDLIPTATVGGEMLFRFDREQGTNQLVAHPAGQTDIGLDTVASFGISGDGRYVVFQTYASASLLVPGATDADTGLDAFLWDGTTDSYQLITHRFDDPLTTTSGVGSHYQFRISRDGGSVVFVSEKFFLAANDSSQFAYTDLFVFDRQTGINTLVSRPNAHPTAMADGRVDQLCDMSSDARFLLFTSDAENMVDGIVDENVYMDLFLLDRGQNLLEWISRAHAPAGYSANYGARCGLISEDGRYLHFYSQSSDLAPGWSDTPSSPDLFIRDRSNGSTALITHPWWSSTQTVGGIFSEIGVARASDGGDKYLFSSNMTALVDAVYHEQPHSLGASSWSFEYDAVAAGVELGLPFIGAPNETAVNELVDLSADGSIALFTTRHPFLTVTGAGSDRDHPTPVLKGLQRGVTSLAAPAAFAGSGSPGEENGGGAGLISGDGSKVLFEPGSSEVCGGTRLGAVCLYDRRTRTFANIHHQPNAPEVLLDAEIEIHDLSQDGRLALIQSKSSYLAPDDTNGTWDLFLYDTVEKSHELISHRFDADATAANRSSDQGYRFWEAADLLSQNGDQVVFETLATDLVEGVEDLNGTFAGIDIYLRIRSTGEAILVSRQAGNPLRTANGTSEMPQVAAVGNIVIFTSAARDLVGGFVDQNSESGRDLYLFDATTGQTRLISHAATSPLHGGNRELHSRSYRNFISSDGRFVLHSNPATNLIANGTDTNQLADVFLYDRTTGSNTLVSHAAGSPLVAANSLSTALSLSSDGRYALLLSRATNLVPGIASPHEQIYLWDRLTSEFRLVSHRQGEPTVPLDGNSSGKLSPTASHVYFMTHSTNVMAGVVDTNNVPDTFIWERRTGNIELVSSRYGEPTKTANNLCSDSFHDRSVSTDGRTWIFECRASDLLPHDNNTRYDLFLAFLPDPFFSDGFESGNTQAWSVAVSQ